MTKTARGGATILADQALARSAARKFAILGILLVAIWVLLNTIWISFPYIRNGTRCIIDAKRERMAPARLFADAPESAARLMIFGDSRALCAFVPDQFDALSNKKVYSQNLGLPGEKEFLSLLETTLAAGNKPTHVFLVVSWKFKLFTPTLWHWVESDRAIAERLFPFRTLPRDAAVFLFDSRKHGGIRAFYEETRQTIEQMLIDRGYHFIAGSSEFPDHRLPDDFTIWNDDTTFVDKRDVVCEGWQFERIRDLADKHDFQIYFVPTYARANSRAEPPPINEATAAAIAPYKRFHLIGPDYKRYPSKYFSDAVHLNREGAAVYTDYLWEVTKAVFETGS